LCVNANKYIEQQFPPINMLRKNNCNLVIGTDSYASNWQLSILDEVKTIQQGAADIPLIEILQWATINGAQALKMDDQLGSFEKNKKPGIVLIDQVNDLKLTLASTAKRIL
jgi:cytosine/adenosine deaminase-related metal-dependent hydrolase